MTNVIPVDFAQVVPPADHRSESEVLGLCLVCPEVIPDVVDRLVPGDFHRPAHGDLYRAILALARAGEPVDIVTVQARCDAQGTWDNVRTVLGRVLDLGGTSVTIGAYIDRVAAASERRRLIHAAETIELAARDMLTPIADVRTKAEHALTGAMCAADTDGLVDTGAGLEALEAVMSAADASDTGVSRVRSGISALDDHTGGLVSPWLVTILAEPGMGKSALALNNYALETARAGGPVLVYSAEMPREQVVGRLCATVSGTPYHVIRRGLERMDRGDRAEFLAATDTVRALPLWIDDSATLTMETIRARSLRHVRRHGQPALVVIDYLQLLSGGVPNPRASVTDHINERSKRAAQLAKELGCPVVMVAQVDKAAQQRRGPVRKADLKGSSGPVDDSRLMLLPYRHSEHNDRLPPGRCQIEIAKFNDGPTRMIGPDFVHWSGRHMRFENPRG